MDFADFADFAAASSPIAMAFGENSRACSISRATFFPAARPTISMRSGMSRATFSALSPMLPVEPRMTTRRFFIGA